jgi:O-antigen/teichoic acid export membrane protein
VRERAVEKLTTDSAYYGISNVAGRFITFLLMPFYTHTLPQAEYGIVVVVYSYIAFLNAVFTFGLEPAYMRHVAGTQADERNRAFTASILFIGAGSLVLIASISLFDAPVAQMLELENGYRSIIPLALAMVALDAINIIPFAALRMEGRARYFAGVKLVSIVLTVIFNVLFIGILRWPVTAVFISGVLASLVSTFLLLPTIRSHLARRIDSRLLRNLLTYGLPTMPGAISIMMIEIIDKPIMQKLTDLETVGLYAANYKLGIFMMLVVTMFRYAWQPFYLQLSAEGSSKTLFARVLTYFVLVGSLIVLTLTLFIGDIVRLPLPGDRNLLPPEYWQGIDIVPIILFGYLWAGIAQILNAGIYIQKKTMLILYATLAGAVVNIVCNFVFIPVWGIHGAAFATFAAYFTIAAFYAVAVRRIFPVHYEYGRLLRIAIAFTATMLAWYLVPAPDFLPRFAWQCIILLFVPAILGLSGFLLPGEKQELSVLARKFTRR